VAKEADEIMSDKDDSDDLTIPERASSDDLPEALPAPRAARFGEGPEGKGIRRERGVSGPRAGFFSGASQFLHDVRAELKRVSWPTASDVKNTTIIVVIAVIFFAVYLFAVDRVIVFVLAQLDRLLQWLIAILA
jgi:preprotein translocase subunit SecE